MSKEINKESEECCGAKKCCGVEKSTVAKFLRHVAEFFDSKQK